MGRRRKKQKQKETDAETSELTGSQRWGRVGVYVISLLMLLSAFSYFTGPPPAQPTEQVDLSAITQVQVRPVGNVSVLAHVVTPTNEYLVVPGEDELSRLNQDVLVGFVSANFSGVTDVTVEISESYIFIRFASTDDFNLSAFEQAIGRRLRDYRIYRGYRASITPPLPEVSEAYLVAEPGLSSGDAVSVVLLERLDSFGSSLLAFQRGRVAEGPFVDATAKSLHAYVLTGTFDDPATTSALKTLALPEVNVSVTAPQLIVKAPANDSRLVNVSETFNVSLLARDENTTALPINASTSETLSAALAERGFTPVIDNGSVRVTAHLDENISTLSDTLESQDVHVVDVKIAGTVDVPNVVILDGIRAPIRDADSFPALLSPNTEVGDDIRVELDYLQLGNQILVYNAREIDSTEG